MSEFSRLMKAVFAQMSDTLIESIGIVHETIVVFAVKRATYVVAIEVCFESFY